VNPALQASTAASSSSVSHSMISAAQFAEESRTIFEANHSDGYLF